LTSFPFLLGKIFLSFLVQHLSMIEQFVKYSQRKRRRSEEEAHPLAHVDSSLTEDVVSAFRLSLSPQRLWRACDLYASLLRLSFSFPLSRWSHATWPILPEQDIDRDPSRGDTSSSECNCRMFFAHTPGIKMSTFAFKGRGHHLTKGVFWHGYTTTLADGRLVNNGE
jgi:hypothetical protein